MEPKPSFFLKFLVMILCVLVFSECVISVSPIKNVVILVMENRSFDHMLGWMKRNNPQINGVTGRESNPESTGDANSAPVYFKDGAEYVDPDPGHSFGAIRDQIFGPGRTSSNGPPPMNGFAEQAIKQGGTAMRDAVMNGFRPEAVPVYADLVREFAVFDNWFASVPASTQPNRLYVHSATSHGATGNVASLLAAGYPQETIFDRIHQAGLDFGIYYQNIPATLFYRNLRKLKYVSKFHNYKPTFGKHARDGKLPDYSVVEQRYMDSKSNPANDDHPSHDVGQGQRFVKEVYETLRSSPQWNTTLLLITYDEHGGFFDHVPTPVSGVPSPDGVVGPVPYNFTFDRLGVRVPTIAVSPWIEKGTVVHAPNGPQPSSQYEHSSIPATMKKIFNLQSDFLTKRDAWAATFEGVLSRSTPRTDCPVKLSEPVMLRKTEANEEAGLSSFQGELVQLASSLNGYYTLKSYDGEEIGKNMTVREANEYVENSLKGFIEAGKQALTMGAHEEEIVKMRPSLTSRSRVP